MSEQRAWPHDEPNGWNLGAAKLVALIEENPFLWLKLTRAKYVELRIDTRDGGFNLFDRDRQPLSPDDIVAAIDAAKADFGETKSLAHRQRQERVSEAMRKYREEHINEPLARLWDRLAAVAMETK